MGFIYCLGLGFPRLLMDQEIEQASYASGCVCPRSYDPCRAPERLQSGAAELCSCAATRKIIAESLLCPRRPAIRSGRTLLLCCH